jgi:hypothetical protein
VSQTVPAKVALFLFLALLITAGCSRKPEGNAASSAQEQTNPNEVQIDLTQAQAQAGAEARVTIPERRQTVTVRIPPGVKDGTRLRLAGQGLPTSDGQPQDFLIKVNVK